MSSPEVKARLGYFTNQYPFASHTFIRREITALEDLGFEIVRYALWVSRNEIVHEEDEAELKKTAYVTEAAAPIFLLSLLTFAVIAPRALYRVFIQAIRMGWRSDRGLLRHFAYVIEAAVLARWCRRDGIRHLHAHFGTNSTAIAMLAEGQTLHRQTHATHAAAFYKHGSGTAITREDVGRHNALDKLVGALVRGGTSARDGLIVMTSRVSIELIQKAARCGAPVLAAISAPTAAAVRLAEASNITLVAVARGQDFEIFAHPERLKVETSRNVA